MAVVEMGKLNLVAMSYEKDKVLNALQKTGATEIKLHSQTEYAAPMTADCESLKEYLSGLEDVLSKITESVNKYISQTKIKSDVPDGELDITYSEFIGAKDLKEEADRTVEEVNRLLDEQKKNSAELAKVKRLLADAEIYASVKQPLKMENTAHARFKLGTIPSTAKENFMLEIGELPLASYSFVASGKDSELIMVAAHKSEVEKTDAVLQSFGFTKCPFDDGRTGEEIYVSLKRRELELDRELLENSTLYPFKDRIRNLKIYCDYVAFELEKCELSEKLLATQTTFLLEAYVPVEAEESVKQALTEVSPAIYFEFSKPSADEMPPTLLKNNKIVRNFEAVTNIYSPPNSREFDPNTVMAFFYSLFLGFIMADVGYGLMMILGGGFLWFKNSRRDNMMGRLGGVFAIGGIFTVIWGVLFNSFFGFSPLPFKVMPDLDGANMSWSLAGINVPALLIISMLIGVVQIFAGYVCLAVQCWRRGKILDGIFDGIVWAVFSIGVGLAIAGFVKQFNVPILGTVGGIIAGASLVVAMLTAGRHEKLLGKFTKGFGSAYGVINYASDILSYARLYGLMLAGAVIADIITSNSVSLISSGNVAFIILGVAIMVIGHVFNLAIGLLGAYIHDARLQYVEFYGRFYEGEGSLFNPLGSKHKHVYVLNK
ncbi:MAG: V-type ATP synthase subunit I [Clostridia bacterium]|nr:V-type ATP synthase subunit I [Clostridia bacterium]